MSSFHTVRYRTVFLCSNLYSASLESSLRLLQWMSVSCPGREISQQVNGRTTIEGEDIMLEKRYVAGKWIYRVPGAAVWSYSRTDAIEQAKQGTQDV
jgi:hypothetical protein